MITNDLAPCAQRAALDYLARGWLPVPIPAGSKGAVLTGWPNLRLTPADVPAYFGTGDNLGLLLGEPSGWLVDVDLDCPEAVELADSYLPATAAITGRPTAPHSHRWYVAQGAPSARHRDPHTNKMIVELRSTGLQTVVGPSLHPSGERYEPLVGEPARVSADELAASVRALAEAVLRKRYGEQPPAAAQPPDDEMERRAVAYLEAMPPAISGEGGHNATYAAATALVHGFGLETERALRLLEQHYNPRCQPPWSRKELEHKITQAATKQHRRPYGWLRDQQPQLADDTDISALLPATLPRGSEPDDPGPTPPHLLHMPGFVDDVVQYTLANAPYPDRALAFSAALSLQALLAGRKVRDASNSRTNLYIVSLANSGAGKDFPRRTNEQILLQARLADCLGDEIGSGEGLVDALELEPSLLFQTDEIDFLMQAMNQPNETRYQRVMQTLLKLYTSSGGLYIKRKKVGKPAGHIDQPCVCLFGTAIPQIFYRSLSLKMLTNGWFARLLIFETPHRGPAREGDRIEDIPLPIYERARWWAEHCPGRERNLQEQFPTPAIVEATEPARRTLRDFQLQCDDEYRQGERAHSQAEMALWARGAEKAKKLALIHACSACPEEPVVGQSAAEWACELVSHQTRRMLFMASLHVADSEFEAKCKQVLELLHQWQAEHGNAWMPFRDISRKLRWSRRDHEEIRNALVAQELIEYEFVRTSGRPRLCYRLPAKLG